MRAGVYARKSTEQRGVSEEEKSVARQIDLARAFIISKDWTLAEGHVYSDDGISGAESTKLVSRARLIEAIDSPRRPFDILVVMGLERLSRDDVELPQLVARIREAGVRIFEYQSGQEVETATALHRGMVSMKATFAAVEREAAQKRTLEGMAAKARAGYWTGSNVFGYDRVRVGSHTELHVNARQAAILVRIFELSAQGVGINRLARQMNAEHAGMRKWSAQGIRDMLTNELYVGRLVFGRTMTVRRKGKSSRVAQTDPSRIVTAERPEWRIISDALWQAVQARKAATFATYLRQSNGRLSGKPERSALASKHLLSGMVQCDHCGGAMVIWSHKDRKPRYQCSTYRGRGVGGCENRWSIDAEQLHELLTTGLRENILTTERLEQLSRDLAAAEETSPERLAAQRAALEADLAAVRAKLAKLTAAIVEGGPLKTLTDAIKAAEVEDTALRAQIEQMDHARESAAAWSQPEYVAKVSRLLDSWRAALDGAPVVARQVFRKVFTGPAVLRHHEDGAGDAWWSYAIPGVFGPLSGFWDGTAGISARPVMPSTVDLGEELRALAESEPIVLPGKGKRGIGSKSVALEMKGGKVVGRLGVPGGQSARSAPGLGAFVLAGKVA